ncbi:uncharacterized protein LOC113335297 [Papaver somniferum]|uniref:uncharacterized protein LOC113335297 n=1 Tax=Papaver somniferum TaxID=3469 RepID=UPI000E700EB1|nr:uncharacterized protein LOC113335297 [Papaver somniferum]
MSHFSTTEEEALIYGWVIASNNPIHGKDKKGAIFWSNIIEEYNKRKGPDGNVRDKKALQTKCNTIRTDVRKYISFVRPYFRNKPTGMTEADYYHRGKQNYEASTGKLWKYDSVFHILKTYQPDYNPAVNNDDGVGTSTQPSQQTQATEENEDDNLDQDFQNMARFGGSSSNSESSDLSNRRRFFEVTDDVRSEGRDQAKKRAREAKASHKSDEKMDKLIDLLENAQAQREAKYEREEEYLRKNLESSTILAQTQQRDSEMKILRQPLDELQECERPIYKIWKNEILARYGSDPIP